MDKILSNNTIYFSTLISLLYLFVILHYTTFGLGERREEYREWGYTLFRCFLKVEGK
jgi:hypothetical protein